MRATSRERGFSSPPSTIPLRSTVSARGWNRGSSLPASPSPSSLPQSIIPPPPSLLCSHRGMGKGRKKRPPPLSVPPLWWYGIASWGERGSKTQGCEEGGGRTLPSSVLGRGGKEGEGKRLGEREGRKEGGHHAYLAIPVCCTYV